MESIALRGIPFIQCGHARSRERKQWKERTNTLRLLSLFPRREERQTDDDVIDMSHVDNLCKLIEKITDGFVVHGRKKERNARRALCKSNTCSTRTDIERQNSHRLIQRTEGCPQRRESRDFFRAAFRGWIICFFAAISMDFMARGRIFCASSIFPALTASTVFRTMVFMSVLCGTRRSRRIWFCRAAFIAECVRGMSGV